MNPPKTLVATVAMMKTLQADFPFIGRWIVFRGEAIGVEFVFADQSTCSTFYDRPGQFCTEPMEKYQAPRIFT